MSDPTPASAKPTAPSFQQGLARRLSLYLIGLGALATLVTGLASYYLSSQALQTASYSQLRGLRSIIEADVETSLEQIRFDLASSAGSTPVKLALNDLDRSLEGMADELAKSDPPLSGETLVTVNAEVKNYYTTDLVGALRKIRGKDSVTVDDLLPDNDITSIIQYFYVVKNPRPGGDGSAKAMRTDFALADGIDAALKKAFINSAFATKSDDVHRLLNEQRRKLGYLDIYLCNKLGMVLYSSAKKTDLLLTLSEKSKEGERKTPLALAYQKAMASPIGSSLATSVIFMDAGPYDRALDTPSFFVACPIPNSQGNAVGVLIYQIPLSTINRMVSFMGRQEQAGLGKGGESYLLGRDFLLRTESRFAGELPAAKKQSVLSDLGDSVVETSIQAPGNPIDTFGSRQGLGGTSGESVYPGPRGEKVIGAFAKIKEDGLDWAVLVEQPAAEAFAPARNVALYVFGIGLLVVACVGIAGVAISRQLTRPIITLKETMQRVTAGDESARAEVASKDEIGELAASLNTMIVERNAVKDRISTENKRLQDNIQQLLVTAAEASSGKLSVRAARPDGVIGNVADAFNNVLEAVGQLIGQAKQASARVGQAAQEINATAQDLTSGVEKQGEQISGTINEVKNLTAAGKEAAENSKEAAAAADQTRTAAQEGAQAVRELMESMENLRTNVDANTKKVRRLGERSLEISGIVKAISEISAQTDMLAMNASIEAARAGEDGRGFSIVADQVRALADRTKDLTTEIEKLIAGIQDEAGDAVVQMEQQLSEVAGDVAQVQQAARSLNNIVQASIDSSTLALQISQSVAEQENRTKAILAAVETIRRIAEDTRGKVLQSRQTSDQLSSLSTDLNQQLANFDIDETPQA
jgi:methyl-accepting chemotaxis protein